MNRGVRSTVGDFAGPQYSVGLSSRPVSLFIQPPQRSWTRSFPGGVAACVPAHALTTIHYLVARYNTPAAADSAIDWLLEHFSIAGIAGDELLRARALGWGDFEDAVVAAAAESSLCEFIITRNISDFARSPVPALTPDEYLASLEP